jgi:hypothetical protein
MCSRYIFVCMLYMTKHFIEPFQAGIWGSQNRGTFSWEEAVRAFINIQLVRVGLLMFVDREHKTRMDHVCLHRPHSCDSIRLYHCVYWCGPEKKHCLICSLCVWMIMWELILLIFFNRLRINHMMRCNLCAYSWAQWGREHLLCKHLLCKHLLF